MGFLLSVIAYIFLIILIIPGIIVGLIVTLLNHTANGYFKDIAISLDKLGNVVCGPLLNLCLIKKNGFQFGNHRHTVSYVLGKNHKDKTLNKLGLFIVNKLDWLDRDHTSKAVTSHDEKV